MDMNFNSMSLRDSRQSWEVYSSSIQEIEEVYADEFAGKGDCVDISMAARSLVSVLRLQYIMGDSKENLTNLFHRFLKLFIKSEQCFQKENERYSPNDIDLTSVRFVSSAIANGECLCFSKAKLVTMASCIPAGIDQLVDMLLSFYQPEREISDVLKDVKKYKQLVEILNSDDPAFKIKKMKNYLDQWPNKLGIQAPDGVRPLHENPTYDGYWCYEAAAVVIVADIDDESFKDHEFYPGELMSWRKQCT